MDKKKKLQVVKDRIYGTYFWENPNGAYLSDGEGRFLTMQGPENDITCMAKMREVATALGFPDGKPVWKVGVRKVTDSEYDLMMERAESGLTPDPADEYLDAIEEYQLKEKNRND